MLVFHNIKFFEVEPSQSHRIVQSSEAIEYLDSQPAYRALIRALSVSRIPKRPEIDIFEGLKGFLRRLLVDDHLLIPLLTE